MGYRAKSCDFIERDFYSGKNIKENKIKIIIKLDMSIEIEFNSVQIDPQKLQEKFPDLISMVNSHLPKKRKPKRRKLKKTMSSMIDEILEDIQVK